MHPDVCGTLEHSITDLFCEALLRFEELAHCCSQQIGTVLPGQQPRNIRISNFQSFSAQNVQRHFQCLRNM